MACRTYTPSSITTHALRNDFFLKNLRDIPFDEHLLSRISSKCSVEAIKNTTFCKLHKVTKGFRLMGSNADRSALYCISRWCRISEEDWMYPMIISFPFPSSPGRSLFSLSPAFPRQKEAYGEKRVK